MILSLMGIFATIYYSKGSATDFFTRLALPISFFSLAIIIAFVSYSIYLSRVQIEFYKDRNRTPKLFKPGKMLAYISRNKLNLCVIGRTNISWFNEVDDKRVRLYQLAIKSGCKLEFVVEHDFVEDTDLRDSQVIAEIKRDHPVVKENFKFIKEKLNNPSNLQLFLTDKTIENSMTKVYSNDDDIKYFSYDISQNISEKPFIVFRRNSVFNELRNKFKQIKDNAIALENYEAKLNKAHLEVENLIKKYNHFSTLRENDNRKLANHYFLRRVAYKKGVRTLPISIQLLITNKCTTKCAMCNHYAIKSENELSKEELKNILQYIKDCGIKNVIISGGEPLYRDFCIEICMYARSTLGLNIGLLTNGIKSGNKSIDEKDALLIKEACDWVQLSIDSFESTTYKEIRNVDYEIVENSLSNLEKASVNLEICYTIQKSNIDEAIDIIKGDKSPNTNVPIRFKFAHGPNNQNNFLIADQKIRTFLQHCKKSQKFNLQYLSEMFSKNYFNVKDVARGYPLEQKNIDFKNSNFKCHILNYSCKIDAQGDLYPCCYLFDDNHGKSKIRAAYKLGSLRSSSGAVPQKTDDLDHNVLKELLISNKKLEPIKSETIPINDNACKYCTRHFYQNDFLNKLEIIADKYDDIKFNYNSDLDCSKLWI